MRDFVSFKMGTTVACLYTYRNDSIDRGKDAAGGMGENSGTIPLKGLVSRAQVERLALDRTVDIQPKKCQERPRMW